MEEEGQELEFLERKKLGAEARKAEEEAIKIQRERERLERRSLPAETTREWLQAAGSGATTLIAVVALGTLILTWYNASGQRAMDQERLTRDNLQSLISNLGHSSAAVRAAAAVNMRRFIKMKGAEYKVPATNILVYSLGGEESHAVRQAITDSLAEAGEEALPVLLQRKTDITREIATVFGSERTRLLGSVPFDQVRRRVKGEELELMARRIKALQEGYLAAAKAISRISGRKPLDLREALFRNFSFVEEVLNQADFTRASLVCADFWGASLKGAIFRKASTSDADFRRADLEGTDFEGADIARADFREARHLDLRAFKNTNWYDARLDPQFADALHEAYPGFGKKKKTRSGRLLGCPRAMQ